MIFYGIIEKSKLRLLNMDLFKNYLNKLEGCKIEVSVKKVRSIRSLSQNALYWVWLEIIANDTGYDKEELHATFRSMFLTDRTKKIPIVRSTTKLNKLQFKEYLDKVERTAGELGIALPEPENYFNNIFKNI